MLRAFFLIVAFVMLVLGAAVTEAQTFGSWYADTSKARDFVFAISGNDSGSIFGQYCYPSEGSCLWLITIKTSCEKGDKYPVLANSNAGATYLEVLCDSQLENGLYRYVFTNFDQVDNLVRQGARIGFALPLQQDEFRVVRFNLQGASEALSVMRSAAENRTQTRPVTRGTRDEKL